MARPGERREHEPDGVDSLFDPFACSRPRPAHEAGFDVPLEHGAHDPFEEIDPAIGEHHRGHSIAEGSVLLGRELRKGRHRKIDRRERRGRRHGGDGRSDPLRGGEQSSIAGERMFLRVSDSNIG